MQLFKALKRILNHINGQTWFWGLPRDRIWSKLAKIPDFCRFPTLFYAAYGGNFIQKYAFHSFNIYTSRFDLLKYAHINHKSGFLISPTQNFGTVVRRNAFFVYFSTLHQNHTAWEYLEVPYFKIFLSHREKITLKWCNFRAF